MCSGALFMARFVLNLDQGATFAVYLYIEAIIVQLLSAT